MEKLDFLKNLKALDVTFLVQMKTGDGYQDYLATPEQLVLLECDQIAGYAAILGVSQSDYLGWVGDNFSVKCSATTVKGKPCQKVVTGGYGVNIQEWVSKQGEYCDVHEFGRN